MTTLADAILSEDIHQVREVLDLGVRINELDEYGFTPLIEAAVIDNIAIAELLLQQGANPRMQDMVGSTALHWAAENNNLNLAYLLLEHGADPNAYTFSGQPVLVMPILRQQSLLRKVLIDRGADLEFAQDFINTKLLGHMFELVGTANIVDPKNQYVEVDFEGFFLEITLGLITDSLTQFKNHFAAKQLRRYGVVSQNIVSVLQRAAELIKFQQYRVNLDKHTTEINQLIKQEPTIIPVGYEGHAITFIKLGDYFIKCDRREDSRLYDNVVIYQVMRPELLTTDFIKNLIYEKQSSEYINIFLPEILQLQVVTELKIAAQISGNCSWANVEACIPVLHFLLSSRNPDYQNNIPHYKSLAINYFNQWREWNKERALNLCIQGFHAADSIRKACKAEILAAILFQSYNNAEVMNHDRIEAILAVLTLPAYEYILQNYIQSYYYEDQSEESQNFMRMLREHGYTKRV